LLAYTTRFRSRAADGRHRGGVDREQGTGDDAEEIGPAHPGPLDLRRDLLPDAGSEEGQPARERVGQRLVTLDHELGGDAPVAAERHPELGELAPAAGPRRGEGLV